MNQKFFPSDEEKEMNEKSPIPLLDDFPLLIGSLVFALVPIISWTVNA
jgi:hypothetical protein